MWPSTLAYAESTAHARAYMAADSALTTFHERFPDSQQGAESIYWRALFRLDPDNPLATPTTAVAALDAYLALPNHDEHAAEVDVLRRIAGLVNSEQGAAASAAEAADSARTQADSARAQADSVRTARAVRYRSKQEEVQRLRDSLDKVLARLTETNQELERIKKRLATPPSQP